VLVNELIVLIFFFFLIFFSIFVHLFSHKSGYFSKIKSLGPSILFKV
jgi:hypothetical protein